MSLPYLVLAGGLTMASLLMFQIALGSHWIRLGRWHAATHKWLAWAMLAGAAAHGTAAYLVFFIGIRGL